MICEHCTGKISHEIKSFKNEPSRHINPGHCYKRRASDRASCFERFIEGFIKDNKPSYNRVKCWSNECRDKA